MAELTAAEKLEVWMYEHPGRALLTLAGALVIVGVIIGMILTTNIYNSEMARMFEEGAETQFPVIFNDRLYTIQDLNMTLSEYVLRYNPFPITPR